MIYNSIRHYWQVFIEPCIDRFEVDETSPEETLAEALYEEHPCYMYEILSKQTVHKRKPLSSCSQMNNIKTAAVTV